MTTPKTIRWVLVIFPAVIGAGLAFYFWNGKHTAKSRSNASDLAQYRSDTSLTQPPRSSGAIALKDVLNNLPRLLGAQTALNDVTALMEQAEKTLLEAPRAEAIVALLEQLDNNVDAPTGLIFCVGTNGNLKSAPTLRVWMLDQLGRLDISTAASYAIRIYARHDSADEWAVALRNDWREAAPAGRIEPVRARALELLANTDWSREPSIGFLEAIDVSVASMAWEAVPRFEAWLDGAQPKALRNAAWIALDRLAAEVPEDFLLRLARSSDWLASQPLLRAGLIARADLSIERQSSAVQAYLTRVDVSLTEGRKFFELVPNVHATVSHNLVTVSRTPTLSEAARLDRVTLSALKLWRARSDLSRWSVQMNQAESRLTENVASAVRGGYLLP